MDRMVTFIAVSLLFEAAALLIAAPVNAIARSHTSPVLILVIAVVSLAPLAVCVACLLLGKAKAKARVSA